MCENAKRIHQEAEVKKNGHIGKQLRSFVELVEHGPSIRFNAFLSPTSLPSFDDFDEPTPITAYSTIDPEGLSGRPRNGQTRRGSSL